MNKLFKDPKKRYLNLLLIILPFLILAGVFGYTSFKAIKDMYGNASGEVNKNDYKVSIEEYGYYLRGNATDLQIEYFRELEDLINDGTDNSAIAACIAKNYVADFYTWTNKNGSYDIGGMHYVYGPSKNVVIAQARNTYYKYLTYYINTFGKDKLLEVTSVETEVDPNPSTYEVDGHTYESYFVTCNWKYKNEETFDGMNIVSPNEYGSYDHYWHFTTREYFTVVVTEDGRFEIVEAFGDY